MLKLKSRYHTMFCYIFVIVLHYFLSHEDYMQAILYRRAA